MAGPRKRDRGGSRPVAAVLLLLCAGFTTSALVAVERHELALRVLFAEWFTPIELALAAGVLADLAALALLLRRWRAPPEAWRPRLPPRALVYLLLAAAAAYLVWLQPYRSLVAQICFGLAAGLAGVAALCGERLLRPLPPRLVSVADLLLLAACVVAVSAELTLRAVAAHSSSPLFARSSDTMLDFMARYRLRPEQATPGFPVNSQGHFDAEFGARRPGVPRAATIGDSFSTSVVPHRYHFTTVAERELGRGEVCNLGIAGMGLNEYLYILREEALPLQPDVVIVDLFIGNDLTDNLSGNVTPGWVEQWLDRDRLLLLVMPRHLWAARDQQAGLRPVATSAGAPGGGQGPAEDQVDYERLYPWLSDPLRELPSFTPERFAIVERHRAQTTCRPDQPPDWAHVFALLLEMRATAAGRGIPFAVMLIPDEFQVEDDVWALVTAGEGGAALDRDLPQRQLGEWLAAQDIPCLDLLPALRAVPPMADGRRHLYQLRDTHFNARGNAVAGEALAEFLKRWWN